MERMPALFVGHGSPRNIGLKNSYTNSLKSLGKTLPHPEVILVVSAHWLTQGTFVTGAARPETIYDFYGFPREFYSARYSCPGSLEWAEKICDHAGSDSVAVDPSRGIDHAAWAVLIHMYPNADIPVLEMSLDYRKPAAWHYDFAQHLSVLREEGLLIVGSGNIVHNLQVIDFENIDATPYEWAIEFDQWVKNKLETGDDRALIDYEGISRAARLAVPTNEHYLPLLYTVGIRNKKDTLKFTHEGIQNASISMRGILFQ